MTNIAFTELDKWLNRQLAYEMEQRKKLQKYGQ